MTTVEQLVDEGGRALRAAQIEPPARESSRLLGHLLGLGEGQLLARGAELVAPEVERDFRALLARRRAGEPMAYLIGEREFYGRDFRVDSRVLIPRPETEHLVEIALTSPVASEARVLDVGTGSGCLAVTLAAERPDWHLVATDLSLAALAVARANARRHGVAARVRALTADLTSGLELGGFDLVVGNLPYVEERDRALPFARRARLRAAARALRAGVDGLGAYRRLFDELAALRADAWLALEIGLGQEDAVALCAVSTGDFEVARTGRDLAGIERNVVLRRTPWIASASSDRPGSPAACGRAARRTRRCRRSPPRCSPTRRCELEGVPRVRDVETMRRLLEHLGVASALGGRRAAARRPAARRAPTTRRTTWSRRCAPACSCSARSSPAAATRGSRCPAAAPSACARSISIWPGLEALGADGDARARLRRSARRAAPRRALPLRHADRDRHREPADGGGSRRRRHRARELRARARGGRPRAAARRDGRPDRGRRDARRFAIEGVDALGRRRAIA